MINIFRFDWTVLVAWLAAFCILEPISYYIIPAFSKSKTVQEYYNILKTPVAIVVFGDFIYSTFLFLVALGVIAYMFGDQKEIDMTGWIQRFLTFVGIQWIGDISFYNIITRIPNTGKYIDFFQRYGRDVALGAPFGDSVYGLFWFLLTQLVVSFPLLLQTILISLFVFGTLVLSY